MKILFFLISILLLQNTNAQNKRYIDENGIEINESNFKEKIRDKNQLLSSWSYIDTKGDIVVTLKDDLYLTGIYNYADIKKQLEKVIRKKIDGSPNLFLEYFFKDDLCTSNSRDNKWTKGDIIELKVYLSPIRKKIPKNIAYICLFEEGIILKNNPNRKREYFYTDEGNFFRKHIFKSPTTCGSYAIIKPNGQTLIRNGEYRPDHMSEHLIPSNWEIFFNTDN